MNCYREQCLVRRFVCNEHKPSSIVTPNSDVSACISIKIPFFAVSKNLLNTFNIEISSTSTIAKVFRDLNALGLVIHDPGS